MGFTAGTAKAHSKQHRNGRKRSRFRPHIWRAWLAREFEDARADYLREGINEMRVLCAAFEDRTRGENSVSPPPSGTGSPGDANDGPAYDGC